jgi:hypothetical protein
MAFIEELTCEADGNLATGSATNMLTAYLRKGSGDTYTLDATHRKLRMPVIWNLAAKPSGEFTFTLHPSSGEPIVFTRQAKKLEPGVIYRIQLQEPVVKTVAISVQEGKLIQGVPNTSLVGFSAWVNNIAEGIPGTIEWYTDINGTNVTAAPAGITVQVGDIIKWYFDPYPFIGIIPILASEETVAGLYYFRVTYDGVISDVGTLTIDSADSSPYFVGSGTESSPYLITTIGGLLRLGSLINATDPDETHKAASVHYRLVTDIGLTTSEEENWPPIGSDNVNSFKGNFDGNGKTISNIRVNRPSEEYNGLFGYVSGTIKNLGLINVKINGSSSTGGLAGSLFSATVSNCYVTGEVKSAPTAGRTINSTGGLAGSASYTTISNCYTLVTVTGETRVGGVAGDMAFNATISNCYATGVITGTDQVGGIAGRVNNNSSTVKDCAALNPMLTRTGSVLIPAFGRVAGFNSGAGGGGALTNNAAWSGMTCNVALGNNNNTAGSDMSATTVTTDGSLEGRFMSSGGWTTAAGSLPGLFGETVEMPEYFLE